MKFYFASATANWEYVQDWILLARDAGHEVTYDWTQAIRAHGREVRGQNKDRSQKAAQADYDGVFNCDVLVNLWSDNQCGALLETGMALAFGREIWVVEKDANFPVRYSVFWELPGVELITTSQLHRRIK